MGTTNLPAGTAGGAEAGGLEEQLDRVRSLSRQLRRAADAVAIGFTIGEEASAVAKQVERFRFTGDDEVDRATLAELAARARRGIREAKVEAKTNDKRRIIGAAGIIVGGRS